MGSENLNPRSNGQVIDETWFSKIRSIFFGFFVPRDTTTLDATNDAGSLGSSTYRWKRAHITVGYWSCGMVKYKYEYSGVSGLLDAGWMLCNGDVVSEANYNALHGAGKWATEIVSSPLNGLKLPTFTEFIIGTTAATQDGSTTISSEGSTSISGIAHTHSPMTAGQASTASTGRVDTGGFANFFESGAHSHPVFPSSPLTTLSSQKPKSIAFHLYMRII